jgi:DNA-binding NtrC family response regulator
MERLMGMCVLVVEDEPIVALDLTSVLEDAGADVLGPALTLEAAERLSDNSRISVAVLDVRIGCKTVETVATKLHDRGVPIVFHTGHGSAGSLMARWPHSVVLVKPAPMHTLLTAVLAASKAPAASLSKA